MINVGQAGRPLLTRYTMSEPANDPPLVTRPEPEDAPPPPSPSLPKPGFLEAVLWCLVFVAVQMLGAILVILVVFIAYVLAAPEPGKFVDEQLAGFGNSMDRSKAEGERPPMPREFGQSLAWGMLAAQFASLALILLVLPRRIGPDWKRQIGVCRPHWFHVVLVLLIVPGFMISAELIQQLFRQLTGMEPPAVKSLKGVFGQFPWPLTALAVAVGPGVVEELWCRGFLGRGLCARYGIVAGVLTTSVLFAAMHMDPSLLCVIILMGAYLHFVYIVTRSIWPPILLHALNNGLGLFIDLAVNGGVIVLPNVVYIASFSLLLFGSVALWTSRATLEPVTLKDEAWWESDGWKPESPGISAPPTETNVRIGYTVVSPVALISTVVSAGVLVYLAFRFAR